MLMIVYNTMVQPITDYCKTLWNYAPCAYIRKVQMVQIEWQELSVVTGTVNYLVYSLIKDLER